MKKKSVTVVKRKQAGTAEKEWMGENRIGNRKKEYKQKEGGTK